MASRTSAAAKGYAEDAPTLTIAGTLIGGGFAVQSEPDEAMNAVRDGIQTARDKVDEATETARQKIDDTATQVDGRRPSRATSADRPDRHDAPTESLEIESDSEMTPAT